MTTPARTITPERKIRLERTFQATLEDVWELWTTKEGIESWWGPEGFTVQVRTLDLRPGGLLQYAMTATAPEQVAFMVREKMPLSTETRATFGEVVPPRRLSLTHHVDFVPGVAPYPSTTLVEMEATAAGVRLVLTLDPMHDQTWTERAVMGWEMELGKLARVLQR